MKCFIILFIKYYQEDTCTPINLLLIGFKEFNKTSKRGYKEDGTFKLVLTPDDCLIPAVYFASFSEFLEPLGIGLPVLASQG